VIATAKHGDERGVIERAHMMSSGRFFLQEFFVQEFFLQEVPLLVS
jgi:hypothetical protein